MVAKRHKITNVPLRSGQFKGPKKSWPPQNVPRNGSKSYCPAKKIMSRIFLNSGTLIVNVGQIRTILSLLAFAQCTLATTFGFE
jgi:hypothetical protein